NAEGNVNLTKTFEALGKANLDATSAFKIFGVHGATEAVVLAQQIASVKGLTDKTIDATGALKEMSQIVSGDAFSGFKRFLNSIKELSVSIGEPLLAPISAFAGAIADVFNRISEFAKAHSTLTGIIMGSVGVIAGLAAGMGTLALVIGGVLSGVGVLLKYLPSLAGVVVGIKTAFETLKTVGSVFASILSAGVAMAAGIGAAIGGIAAAGVVWLGGWRREAKELETEAAKNAETLKGKAREAGFEPDLAPKKLEKTEVEGKSVSALIEMRKKETIALEGYIGKLEEARSKADDKGMADALKWIAIQRSRLKGITDEITAIRAREEALKNEQVVMIQSSNIFTQAAAGFKTIEDRLKAINGLLDFMVKYTQEYYHALNQAVDVTIAAQKARITEETKSPAIAAAEIARVEVDASAEKIKNAQAEYAEKKRLREEAYNAEVQLIDQELVSKKDQSDIVKNLLKERADAEKQYRDKTLADEKVLRDAIIEEIKREYNTVKTLLEQRRTLEQQMADEVRAARQTTYAFMDKEVGPEVRIREGLVRAKEALQEAVNLMPTAPERAIELAKNARQMFVSLAQDINSLESNFRRLYDTNTDLLHELNKKGVSPAAGWVMDLERVRQLEQEVIELAKQGRWEEASAVAEKAKQGAAALAQAPEGVNKGEALAVAKEELTRLIQLQEDIERTRIEEAKRINLEAEQKAEEASKLIQDGQQKLLELINQQLSVHQEQLNVLQQIRDGLGQSQTPQEKAQETISKESAELQPSVIELEQKRLQSLPAEAPQQVSTMFPAALPEALPGAAEAYREHIVEQATSGVFSQIYQSILDLFSGIGESIQNTIGSTTEMIHSISREPQKVELLGEEKQTIESFGDNVNLFRELVTNFKEGLDATLRQLADAKIHIDVAVNQQGAATVDVMG
ncbi:MAG: phage tail tape measure protein, partial [Infirmifilum sp.]